jgi:hypothetical protein
MSRSTLEKREVSVEGAGAGLRSVQGRSCVVAPPGLTDHYERGTSCLGMPFVQVWAAALSLFPSPGNPPVASGREVADTLRTGTTRRRPVCLEFPAKAVDQQNRLALDISRRSEIRLDILSNLFWEVKGTS